MRMTFGSPGSIVFAIAVAGLGLLSLLTGHFASVWQPVPQALPWREYFAYANGILMCAVGVGLLFPRSILPASVILTFYLSIWLLFLHLPQLIAAPLQEVSWAACAHNTELIAGGWILLALSGCFAESRSPLNYLSGIKGVRSARMLFAVSLPFLGLQHMVYLQAALTAVPVWLPYRLGWVYFTGAAHIAAGIAIGFAVYPRLAATLEAIMMGSFTVLFWLPAVIVTPRDRFQWTGLLISSAMTAAAWIAAESYRGVPGPNRGLNRKPLRSIA